jgi:hypothetical protein
MSCGHPIIGSIPIKNNGSMGGWLCNNCAKSRAKEPNFGFCLDNCANTGIFKPIDENNLDQYRDYSRK